MIQIARRLTYADVMSSIAVFLVLAGGTALAAGGLAKNSVGTNQLKKNAVTNAKLRNGSVTGAKLRDGTITGPKIDLSSLGTVPSATSAASAATATTAAKAGHATSADIATEATRAKQADTATEATHAAAADIATVATDFSRYGTTGMRTAALGTTVVLGSVGPFTVKGHCEEEGPAYLAFTTLETSRPGSFLSSPGGNSTYEEGKFEPGEEVEIGTALSRETKYWYVDYDDDQTGWTAVTPDGSVILKGYTGNGVHVFGAACAFETNWMNNG